MYALYPTLSPILAMLYVISYLSFPISYAYPSYALYSLLYLSPMLPFPMFPPILSCPMLSLISLLLCYLSYAYALSMLSYVTSLMMFSMLPFLSPMPSLAMVDTL